MLYIPIQIPNQNYTRILQAISTQTGTFANEQDNSKLLPQLSLFEDEQFIKQYINSSVKTQQLNSSFTNEINRDNFIEQVNLSDRYKKFEAYDIFHTLENRSINICKNVNENKSQRKNIIAPMNLKAKLQKRGIVKCETTIPSLRVNVAVYQSKQK
ncbi:Hypothetical_protein [Hexamita inflata]|uniref:Hypothetical_protein n=1 Tax=Hexamita inflata TaxID=28002 RepID=A0AA86Q9M1_9EUKA|nr:Hypothetical protein HINF_LOCUS42546 [Hexamita inflata]